jgi:hypothetical protein
MTKDNLKLSTNIIKAEMMLKMAIKKVLGQYKQDVELKAFQEMTSD